MGVITSIVDEQRVTAYFRGLGYRSRGIGADGLGRRIYIGPFVTEGALREAIDVARQAGFISPYPAALYPVLSPAAEAVQRAHQLSQ